MNGILRQSGARKENLIDGKYLFSEPNMLTWSSDREVLYMYMPLPSRDYQRLAPDDSTARQIEQGNGFELVKFAETETVYLLDEDMYTDEHEVEGTNLIEQAIPPDLEQGTDTFGDAGLSEDVNQR